MNSKLTGFILLFYIFTLCQTDSAESIKVRDGFEATLFAGPELADDIYSMTLDANGRVVVSGRGYIRILHDNDGDGRADKAIQFARLDRGTMGMLFDGSHLWTVANRALLRYEDANRDGRADGPPQQFLRLANGEHGAHAIRKGPDGWLYLVGGNDTGFSPSQFNSPQTPLSKIEGGAIIRFSPDGKAFEALSCGFRNPYDFDFNWRGDLFTYDSDTERTFYLPWYTPTRLYHAAIGGHHGWRMPGYKRSWARPGYYADTVPDLYKVGRGSPTGVAVYSHRLIPKEMHDGMFILDWTFGNVWFYPMQPANASYQTSPQLFISPVGTDGFAPSDIEVGREGELYISIGGRGTKGSVFRVVPTQKNRNRPNIPPSTATPLGSVLNAPQPLAEWSRAQWQPLAKQIGAGRLVEAALNVSRKTKARVRAIEVLTEMFNGLDAETAAQLAKDGSLDIRARTAWAISRFPEKNATKLLTRLALDSEDYVRVKALEAMLHILPIDPSESTKWLKELQQNFNQTSIRVRLVSARLASKLPEPEWQKIDLEKLTTQGEVTAATAAIWRKPDTKIHANVARKLLSLISINQDANLNLDILRTIILALGDYNLERPSRESFTGYEIPFSLTEHPGLAEAIAIQIAPLMDTLHPDLHREAGRLLAMVNAQQPELVVELLNTITPETDPVDDFHKLIVTAKLPSTFPDTDLPRLADALMSLDTKLQSRGTRPKLNWTMRFVDIAQAHVGKQPELAKQLIAHDNFPTGSHLAYARLLSGEERIAAARRYLSAMKTDPEFVCSIDLIDLLDSLPFDTILPVLRKQWANLSIRPAILQRLAKHSMTEDRSLFLDALLSRDNNLANTALAVLKRTPASKKPSDWSLLVRKLKRECGTKGKASTRKEIAALLSAWSGHAFSEVKEKSNQPADLFDAWQPVFNWFSEAHPTIATAAADTGLIDAAKWETTFAKVDWGSGDLSKGRQLFVNRACQGCHSDSGALGPSLSGAAKRFSPEDLFRAILFPNRDISPLYQFNEYRLRNGDVHVGRTAFYAADGVVLRTGAGIVRLNQAEIVSQQTSRRSIMPEGLLEGLNESDLADLYQHLKSL